MSEAHGTAGENTRTTGSAPIDTICDFVRRGLEAAASAVTPPEAAGRHFRAARIEVLKGIRELVDLRIDHLSRANATGTRVNVD